MQKIQRVALLLGSTLLLAWFLLQNQQLLPQLLAAIQQGSQNWLLVALGSELAALGFLTTLYYAAFRAVGAAQSFRRLVPQTLASTFVDSTAPAGGAAGAAVFIAQARQQTGSRTAVGVLLSFIANYGVYIILLLLAMLFLAWQQLLTTTILSMAATLIAAVCGLLLLLWLAANHTHHLQRLLKTVRRCVNGAARLVGRGELLSETWVTQQTADLANSATAIGTQPQRLAWVLTASLLMHISLISVLATVLLALHQPLTLSLLLIGYTMHVLLTNISPTPNGIGVVEVALPPILGMLGLSAPVSVAVTLLFRAFTFWVPLLLGFLATRYLQSAPVRTA